jgi:gliding motility-associated-like protein
VGSYPPATADITNAQFNNSNCNQSDGSITGMVFGAVIPFVVVWHNAEGVEVGTGPDLLHVPAGSYTATVSFGDNCSHEFGPYPITDNNATQIADVLPTPDHCNQGMGGLSVLPASGNPADFLYSLNGGPYQANGGLFTGLVEGEYHISLKDAAGCISNVYTQVIENIPGPEIHCFPSPATGSSSDGRITVISPNSGLTYQLEGYPPQTTNEFTDLSAGEYYVWVTDAFGCSTPDTVIVGSSPPGLLLLALAGTDRKCLNKPARSDIGISRVSEMTEMKATLYYDGSLLNCTNFNANGDVFPNIQSQLFASPPRVEIFWQSAIPVSSSDTLTLGTFIFETTQAGTADIYWEELSPVTYFLNASQDTIYPVFHPGIIEVFEIPKASINSTNQVCEEDSVTLLAEIAGGADPMDYAWQTPTGSSQAALSIPITNAQPQDGGLYRFTVKDLNNCADTLVYNLEVVPKPTANFPTTTDTIYYEQQTQLQATPGYASYQWNTGDTTYFINVSEEGDYSVLMQTAEGCSKLEKVTLVDTWFPFNIPNAFTPNGDGLNDTFHPVTDYDRFSKFSMVIYNSWGQKQFETTNPADGWDGKDAAAGVYVWVITYADYLGKVSTLRGSVTVVR